MTRTVRGWAAAGVAVLAVTGCAPAPVAPARQRATGAGSATTPPAADCARATKATIAGKLNDASFTPGTVTVQRGGFLAVTNKSSQIQGLVTKPDAGLVTTILDQRERQVIQFPQAGTFVLHGAGGAIMHVTVAGDSGCGAPKPTLTLKGRYEFSPAKLTVDPTVNFTVVNTSSAAHTLACDPDTGISDDHTRLEQGETEVLAIDQPGTYTCHSTQHPSAKVVITVAG